MVQNTTRFREKGFGARKCHRERTQHALKERNPFGHVQRLAGGCHGPGKKLLREVDRLLPQIRKLAHQHLVSEGLRTKLTWVFYCFPTHFYVLEGQT